MAKIKHSRCLKSISLSVNLSFYVKSFSFTFFNFNAVSSNFSSCDYVKTFGYDCEKISISVFNFKSFALDPAIKLSAGSKAPKSVAIIRYGIKFCYYVLVFFFICFNFLFLR